MLSEPSTLNPPNPSEISKGIDPLLCALASAAIGEIRAFIVSVAWSMSLSVCIPWSKEALLLAVITDSARCTAIRRHAICLSLVCADRRAWGSCGKQLGSGRIRFRTTIKIRDRLTVRIRFRVRVTVRVRVRVRG